jgi:hypothetical protein
MMTAPFRPVLLARLAVGAAAAVMTLATCADANAAGVAPAATTHDSTTTSQSSAVAGTAAARHRPRLISYAGGESPGAEVQNRADARRLAGAPRSFKRYIGTYAVRLNRNSTCSGEGYVGVTVERLRTDGFAVGGVNDCGGYMALWVKPHRHWKEVAGTQDSWDCKVLKRYSVPSSVVGTTCYDYANQKQRHYHQR